MNNQNEKDFGHKAKYSQEISDAEKEGMDSYQSWFNTSASVKQSIVNGFWDFGGHILTRKVVANMARAENKSVLEIGYGGGRILLAASKYFGQAVGVDIHANQTKTEEFLHANGCGNFKLYTTESGRDLPVADSSVDLVYTFIVMQHLQSFGAFSDYVKESSRVLKQGGVAQIYFGRYSRLTMGKSIYKKPLQFVMYLFRGYKEIPEAKVNHVSLVIHPWRAFLTAKMNGFRVVDCGYSWRTLQDGGRVCGGQHYLTMIKK
jgi:ubiquinone/menaquinone biosynthesis C-methylase UbiE